jgi:hypothetical protein
MTLLRHLVFSEFQLVTARSESTSTAREEICDAISSARVIGSCFQVIPGNCQY